MTAKVAIYVAAALPEIARCFACWTWIRQDDLVDRSGRRCLVLFALLLTRLESDFAGRAYAAYGGVYITASFI